MTDEPQGLALRFAKRQGRGRIPVVCYLFLQVWHSHTQEPIEIEDLAFGVALLVGPLGEEA